MKIQHVGAIVTGIVIALGIAMVLPAFVRANPPQLVLLSFSVVDEQNIPNWCQDLSSVLTKYNAKAAVFFTGKVAEKHPDCITNLPKYTDIGSQTYDYVSLTSIPDYETQLSEVKNGKAAIDKAGNLDSRLFRAPHGLTDINIYSILSRSDILADFSYSKQYNKYYDGQFIKFDLVSYNGTKYSPDFFRNVPENKPVLVNFDNSIPINKIDDFISHLKPDNVRFVSATDLTSLDLTVHEDNKA